MPTEGASTTSSECVYFHLNLQNTYEEIFPLVGLFAAISEQYHK